VYTCNKLCSRGYPGDSYHEPSICLFVDIGAPGIRSDVCKCFFLGSVGAVRDVWETCTCLSMPCNDLHVLVTYSWNRTPSPLHNQIYPNSPLVASTLLGERSRVSAEFIPRAPGSWWTPLFFIRRGFLCLIKK